MRFKFSPKSQASLPPEIENANVAMVYCFVIRQAIAKELGVCNNLKDGAMPKIDTANTFEGNEEFSERIRLNQGP